MTDIPHFKDDDFRLLFLDIDDVINSTKTCIVHGCYPWPSTSRSPGGRFILDDPPVKDVHAFDQINVKLVDKLCRITNTHIVLSSTWRIGLDAMQVRRMLQYIGFTPELVIGRTCHGMRNWCRGDEIEHFLGELKEDPGSLIDRGLLLPGFSGRGGLEPKSYVILDDSSDMLDHQRESHFVHVAPLEGLSLADVVKAGGILTQQDFAYCDLK